MWQAKYALPLPKDYGLGLNFQPCTQWMLFPLWASVVRDQEALTLFLWAKGGISPYTIAAHSTRMTSIYPFSS